MTAQELHDHIGKSTSPPLLLDVREPWEHKLASIPGAKLVPLRQIPAELSQMNRGQEIAIFCHLGVRSRQVGMFLEQQGFTRLINLMGGIDSWSQTIDSTIPRY